MSKQIHMIQAQLNAHWRDSFRPVRFFAFDGRCSIVVPILVFHIRVYTLVFCIILLFIFRFLEKKGLTFPAALRSLRCWIIGRTRPGYLGISRHVFREYYE